MPVSTVTQLFYLVSTQKKKPEIWTSYLRRPERSSCGTLRRNRPLCVLSHLIPSATDKETRTPWVRSLSRSQELIKDLEGPSGLKGPGLWTSFQVSWSICLRCSQWSILRFSQLPALKALYCFKKQKLAGTLHLPLSLGAFSDLTFEFI